MNGNKGKSDLKSKFKIDINTFEKKEKIKSGGFGMVFKVFCPNNNEYYAAKIITYVNNEKQNMTDREIEIMMNLQHPTIINFIGYSLMDFEGKFAVTIIMDLANKGSLDQLLQNSEKSLAYLDYNNTARQIILVGITRGMMILHQHNILHRDLKPGNILLDDYLHPLISDFGLSTFYEKKDKSDSLKTSITENCGTPIYMAPEVISDNFFDGKSDVYSFGILMFEILTETVPYPELENKKITLFQFYQKVIDNYRPKFTVPIKKSFKELIEKCWSKDPNERPTFEEIFNKLKYNKNDDQYLLDDVDIDEFIMYVEDITDDNYVNDVNIYNNIYNLMNKQSVDIQNKKILFSKFNMLPVKIQQKFIETIIKQIKNEELHNCFKNVNNLLIYFLTFIKSSRKKNCFEMSSIKPDDILMNTQEKYLRFNILSNFVETLVSNKSFNLNTFIDLLKKIKNISIEISYPANSFDKAFELLKKCRKRCNFNISVFIAKVEETDDKLIKNSMINSIRFDSHVSTIKDNSFFECYSLKSVTLPSSIKKIGMNAFSGCFSLKEIVIPSSVAEIGCNAFKNCQNLEQITIPSSITIIKSHLFDGCHSLKHISIPSSVISIEDYAFNDCKSLTQLIIPSSVLSIGDFAFNGCSSLKRLFISSSVKVIGHYAFKDCSSLIYAEVPILERYGTGIFDGCLLSEIKLHSSLIEIDKNTLCYCQSVKKIIIPSSVVTINDYSFSNFNQLEEIFIPDSVTRIGMNAFSQCSSLIKVVIPFSVENIEMYTFEDCSALIEINIPPLVTTIQCFAFIGCSSLKKITIPQNVNNIEQGAFFGCQSITNISLPPQIKIIETGTFCGCDSLTNIIIPTSVSIIADYAFCGCISLKEITIPSSVSYIDEKTFCGCNSLTKIVIPESIKEIGESSFEHCISLSDVIIPSSVETIGAYSFKSCSSLKEIVIPSSVKYIADQAFFNCESLEKVVIHSELTSIQCGTFCECTSLKNINLPSSLQAIYGIAFAGCKSLEKIEIPDSVKKIGVGAFMECSSLINITIPPQITEINNQTFQGCSSLNTVSLPSMLRKIGYYSFAGCSSLSSITIPSSVKLIEEYAFYNCSSLITIKIPENIEFIEPCTFLNCESLTFVDLSKSVKTIGHHAFKNCSSLTKIDMSGVSEVGESIFQGCKSLNDTNILINRHFARILFGKNKKEHNLRVKLNNETYLKQREFHISLKSILTGACFLFILFILVNLVC